MSCSFIFVISWIDRAATSSLAFVASLSAAAECSRKVQCVELVEKHTWQVIMKVAKQSQRDIEAAERIFTKKDG